VVSGKGQYLIPGLIDSHVHLASVPGMSFDQNEGKQKMIQEYFKQLPRSYLYYGYTTVVDLAVVDRQVLEDFRQAPLHPDLYDCGGSLPFANGYPCMSMSTPLFGFLPHKIHRINNLTFFSREMGLASRRGALVLGLREHETLEAAERSRFLCPRHSNASLSVVLRPLQSLNWNNLKQPCSIRLLLHTHDGAMSTLSKGSSLGIAASLD
jgi:hypothetical protein